MSKPARPAPVLTPDQHAKAVATFEAKAPNVAHMVGLIARNRRIRPETRLELQQQASLHLWLTIARMITAGEPDPGARIDCMFVVRSASDQLWRARRRDRNRLAGRMVRSVEATDHQGKRFPDPPVRETSITVSGKADGLRYTLADAWMDSARTMAEHAGPTVSVATVAVRLGVSPQYVQAIARDLGGLKVGAHWQFPASTGLDRQPAGTAELRQTYG